MKMPLKTSGKLRHGADDIDAFAQWIGRKIRNHDPMIEVDDKKGSPVRDRLGLDATRTGVVHYAMRNGRKFEIEIRETTDQVAGFGLEDGVEQDEGAREDAPVSTLKPAKLKKVLL